MVREYNLKLLSEHNPEDPLPMGMMPTLDKSKFPGCGYSFPMRMQSEGKYIWEDFVDLMYEQSKHKFDKKAVKEQLAIIEPALKREISHNLRTNLPGHELVGSLAPCGSHWDDFQDAMLRRGVGASTLDEFHNSMDSMRHCVVEQYAIENKFWKEMMNMSIHMSQVMTIVNQAKKNEGLTEDKAHEFFSEMNEMMRNRQTRQEAQKEDMTHVPRAIE